MADLVDVENALVALIAQTLYPNGTSQPSITGVPTVAYVGWPSAANLDADLAAIATGAGKIHVTVFPTAIERNTTRFPKAWQPQVAPVQTLSLSVNGQQVTVGGTVATPQNVMLMVNRSPVVYAVQATDTLTSIATALSLLVSGASSAGAVVTLPNSAVISAARVGASGTSIMEIRRQDRVFQISIWADTPANRDLTAQVVDVALATTEFLTMPDLTAARLIYRNSMVDDMVQKANLFSRNLMYSVEYATTVTQLETQITQDQLNVNVAVAGVAPYVTAVTVFD